MIDAPTSSRSSGSSALTVAFVPTGMNSGVSTDAVGQRQHAGPCPRRPSAGGGGGDLVARRCRRRHGRRRRLGPSGPGSSHRPGMPGSTLRGAAAGPRSRGRAGARRPRSVAIASLRRPVEEPEPQEERLVDVLDRLDLLATARRPARPRRPARSRTSGRSRPAARRSVESSPSSSMSSAAIASRAVSSWTRPSPCTWAWSRTRLSSRLTMRGVPRPRRAIARTAAASIGTSRMPADRLDDLGQLVLGVEVEAVGRPEAIAQRGADAARARRRADDRERLEAEPQAARRRALADHHVEREVLHRRVEDLLDRAVQPMDLVDEQDVALVERRQDRGEVARPLDRRPGRVADVDAELARDDRREGRLAEAGRAVQQDVVGCLSPALAAWSRTERLALTSAWPMYSPSVLGRSEPSMTGSVSSSRSADRMRLTSSTIARDGSTGSGAFVRMF